MKNIIYIIILLTISLYGAGADADEIPQNGNIVFQTNFDTPVEQNLWKMTDTAKWAKGYKDTTSLCVSVPAEKSQGVNLIKIPFDLSKYRGCRLLFECMAKADNVNKPPKPYLGVKFMLHYRSKSEGPFWKNENNVFGTFDWQMLQFSVLITNDAEFGEINLGLQDSSGTVWFDDIKITVEKKPIVRPEPLKNPPPVFKGHNLPRLRGVMSPNEFHDEDLRILGSEWKANVIRWQITRNWGKAGTDRDIPEYDKWFDGKLDELDKVLGACERYGIKVVVDMHSPPGGRYENKDLAIFFELKYQEHWIKLWEKIAKRYKGSNIIWGYDLVNEPVQTAPAKPETGDYVEAQMHAAKAIRKIDPDIPIFIESANWDSAEGFKELEPVNIPNIIYEVHMYNPHRFTHQGVSDKWTPIKYPGEISEKKWDKLQIRKELQPVRDFQLAYNVHIYVGEFSAIRWAPGAYDYLRDCIDIFEEYGWDWTYHAYREWDGWSVEHGSDPKNRKPVQETTDRKKLLLEWFAKNMKPEKQNKY